MKNVPTSSPPGFGSPRRRGATSCAYTPTKGFTLPRFELASSKRKRYDRSGPTTKGFPSDDGSQARHSGIVHIERNCRARKKSEIVGGTKDDQTQRSDIDRVGAAKRQKSNNKRSIKATRLALSEKYTVNGKPVETERFRVEAHLWCAIRCCEMLLINWTHSSATRRCSRVCRKAT